MYYHCCLPLRLALEESIRLPMAFSDNSSQMNGRSCWL